MIVLDIYDSIIEGADLGEFIVESFFIAKDRWKMARRLIEGNIND